MNLPAPPSSATDAIGRWLRDLHRYIESQPQHSVASFGVAETPNSRVSGFPGDMVTNIGSGSTDSRLWLLGGTDRSIRTDQGWVIVRVVAP